MMNAAAVAAARSDDDELGDYRPAAKSPAESMPQMLENEGKLGTIRLITRT